MDARSAARAAAPSLLRQTYLHIPGIGPAGERALWAAGLTDWRRALAAAQAASGGAPRQANPVGGALAARLLRHLPAAEAALAAGDASHFAALARYGECWRLYGGFSGQCLYLDIETNGAAGDEEEITLIGASRGAAYRAFLAGEDLEQFPDWLEKSAARVLVTFNGAGFDVPALRRRWRRCPLPAAHIDLRFAAPKAGLKGGLKRIEPALGLTRPPELAGLDGWDAVRLWWAWRNDGDRAARKRLIAYNRCDVMSLVPLLAHVHGILSGLRLGAALNRNPPMTG